jgi:hypothetical protein
MVGRPVVSWTKGVLMKPQPSQVMPFGLARMSRAGAPAISSGPRSWLALEPVTSLRMIRAGLASLGLAESGPASRLLTVVVLLLRTVPWGGTSKRWYWLCDSPAALGGAIWMIGKAVVPAISGRRSALTVAATVCANPLCGATR